MLIVTPNPAIDHTVYVKELRLGQVLRTGPGRSVAGGKGANVARATAHLGGAGTVFAFVPEAGAAHLQDLYAAENLSLVPTEVPGRVRVCTAMIEDDGRVTLLNEPGAQVTAAEWDQLIIRVTSYAKIAAPGPLICAGSLPPGSPTDSYARLVTVGRSVGREVVVDASGEVLAAAIAAGADVVTPNVAEAERMLGITTSTSEEVDEQGPEVRTRAIDAAAGLQQAGAQWVVVTAGGAGAAVAGRDTAGDAATWWFSAPEVIVRNPIGAGDSFVAGMATARMAGAGWLAAIVRGLASGSASVEQQQAGVVDPVRVAELTAAIASSSGYDVSLPASLTAPATSPAPDAE